MLEVPSLHDIQASDEIFKPNNTVIVSVKLKEQISDQGVVLDVHQGFHQTLELMFVEAALVFSKVQIDHNQIFEFAFCEPQAAAQVVDTSSFQPKLAITSVFNTWVKIIFSKVFRLRIFLFLLSFKHWLLDLAKFFTKICLLPRKDLPYVFLITNRLTKTEFYR